MRFQQERLYLSTFINSFGSWLTFLAIALLVQEKYGGQQVAWIFLVQTLPAILFSRSLANLVPIPKQEKYYAVLQAALSLTSLVLCFNQSLPILYAHLFVSASLKSVSAPLFNTLVGRWIPNEKIKETFTRIGSVQASTLALAPIAGAWIKIASSAELLFFIDALTFIISVILLADLLRKNAGEVASVEKPKFKDIFSAVVSLPQNIPAILWRNLLLWFGFLILGALLNALEFAGFERLQMNERWIGYALAAWGLGSLAAFLKKSDLPATWISFIFIASLVVFLTTAKAEVAIGIFAVAGWASALFSGILRSDIQTSVPESYNALPVWAFANQITQAINLIAYAGVGLLLNVLGFSIFAAITLGVGLVIQIALSLSKRETL
jgi:MFS family permease